MKTSWIIENWDYIHTTIHNNNWTMWELSDSGWSFSINKVQRDEAQ